MDLFKKIQDLIMRDVANENETKKSSVIMRCTSIFLAFFFVIQTIDLFIAGYKRAGILSVCCIIGYAGAFILTYQGYTILTQHYIEVLTLGWIAAFIALLGWNCSYQHIIFTLFLFSLLTSYQDIAYKVLWALFLCVFRIVLYIYAHTHVPHYTVNEVQSYVLNIVNTTFTFCLFFVIAMLFAKDSMEMEQKLMKYNKKIEKLAKTDTLTNLPNRRDAIERIEKHVRKSNDTDFYLNIAIGDIDFFKRINDTFGHEAGDAILVQLSDIFRDVMKESGFAARWGGEEFLFVFTSENADVSAMKLNDLRTKISQTAFKYNDTEMHLTMTFGLEEYDFHRSIDDLINSADQKLYLGKTKGRNQVVF